MKREKMDGFKWSGIKRRGEEEEEEEERSCMKYINFYFLIFNFLFFSMLKPCFDDLRFETLIDQLRFIQL